MSFLAEKIKSFLEVPQEKHSAEVPDENVIVDMTSDGYYTTGDFFDEDVNMLSNYSVKSNKIEQQKVKIMQYRSLSKTPDVNDAIEEIVNEIAFNPLSKSPLKIDIDEENETIKNAIFDKFKKISKIMKLNRNLYRIVKSGYVDGQVNMFLSYGTKEQGINGIKMVEPVYLYFDSKKKVYKYYNKSDKEFYMNSSVSKGQEYSPEELVHEDFGLREDGMLTGYLEYALKPANQLRTLEDLLIPMRFSRSISRRVFNVDIGNLPNKKGEQAMTEMQKKFKYKKFYNVNTGEISNQQHITSMVEDYWFANRNGGKGTQVDTLDESGNLGELDDILYFNKKLYKAMYIPSNRISINPDSDNSYDYDTTEVTKEDVKFFMFVSRLRLVYTETFKEILKRELIYTGVLTAEEYLEYEEKITLTFVNENSFIENMRLDMFSKKIDMLGNLADYSGKFFSYEKIFKDVFKYNDEEIKELLTSIQKEKKDPMYKSFYEEEDF